MLSEVSLNINELHLNALSLLLGVHIERLMNNNVYVISVDMENRSADDSARDAAIQIAALCDKLLEQQQKRKSLYDV